MNHLSHLLSFEINRDETRGGEISKAIRDIGFDLKLKIKKVDLNDQILIVNSSLIGDTAKDIKSFIQGLLRC